MQSIFLHIHWECSIQWSQQIRAAVLKWLNEDRVIISGIVGVMFQLSQQFSVGHMSSYVAMDSALTSEGGVTLRMIVVTTQMKTTVVGGQ